MSIVLHLIWKDLILCRWAFGVLMFYYGSYVVMNWNLMDFTGGLYRAHEFSDIYTSIGPFLSFIVVSLLALSDPISDSDAFHRSRPISRGKLFAAKAILCALVAIGVPVLAHLTLAANYGVELKFVWISSTVSGLSLFFVLALGATSKSLIRLITLYVVLVCVTFLPLVGILNWRVLEISYESISELWTGPTRAFLKSICLGICAVSVCAFQYAIKKNHITIGLAAVSFLMVQGIFSGNLLRLSLINPSFEEEMRIEIQVDPRTGRYTRPIYDGLSRTKFENAFVYDADVSGSDLGGDELYPVLLNGRLEIEGDFKEPSYRRSIYRKSRSIKYELDKVAETLGIGKYLNPPLNNSNSHIQARPSNRFSFLDIDESLHANENPFQGNYSGKLGVFRMRYIPVMSMSLADASEKRENHYFGRIENVLIDKNRLRFTAFLGYMKLSIDRQSPYWLRMNPVTESDAGENGNRGMLILLINRKRGEAIIPSAFTGEKGNPKYKVGKLSGWFRTATQYDVVFDRPAGVDEAWIENAEIVVVDKHVVYAQEVEFEIENVRHY